MSSRITSIQIYLIILFLFVNLLISLLPYNSISFTNVDAGIINNPIREISPNAQGYVNLTEIGEYYDATSYAFSIFLDSNFAFVADGNDGLEILNVSDPSNPSEIGDHFFFGYTRDVAIKGNYAYIAASNDGLRVVNISTLSNPSLVNFHYDGSGLAFGVTINGSYAFVADSSDGLEIINITDPTNPIEVGEFYDGEGSAKRVTVRGSYAFVADLDDGLEIINASDPTNPIKEGEYSNFGFIEAVAIDGSYAYLANHQVGLEILDISDLSNPTKINEYSIGNNDTLDVIVSDGFAYIAKSDGGVEIINVSNPYSIVKIGEFYDGGSASSLALNGSLLYVADGDDGIEILALTLDSDGDGLSDENEINVYGTNPNNDDTDSDGYTDGEEVKKGTNPLDPMDYPGATTPPTEKGGIMLIPTTIFSVIGLSVAVIIIKKRNKIRKTI